MTKIERAARAAALHAGWSVDPSLSPSLRAYHRRETMTWAKWVMRATELAVAA